MSKKLVLTPEILKLLLSEDEVKGYEDWECYADTSTGDFDREKGAMVDYEITLHSPKGETYLAIDGYYTNQGHEFNGLVSFYETQPEFTLIMTKEEVTSLVGVLKENKDKNIVSILKKIK